jgi:hypothetical protein
VEDNTSQVGLQALGAQAAEATVLLTLLDFPAQMDLAAAAVAAQVL